VFYNTVRVYAIQAQSTFSPRSEGDFKIKYQNHNLVNAIVGKTILQGGLFLCLFLLCGAYSALPLHAVLSSFVFYGSELLAVALALKKTHSRPATGVSLGSG
jgi:hypothetical protein